jgi:aspartate aminotransferase
MNTRVAAPLQKMPSSQSIVATDRARDLIRQGRDIVLLTIGEPDFDTPDYVKRAAIEAIERGETKYPPVDGINELKEAVCYKFLSENGIEYSVEQISVANGAKQIIFNALVATLNPGDQVIVPTPYWVSYPAIGSFTGADVIYLKTQMVNGLKIDPAELRRAINPHTRWLILNSPGNPSGAVYSEAELRQLAEVLVEHEQVLILTDDIYEHLVYDDVEFKTLAQVAPELSERILTVNGVSKAYAMTGWRIGFAGGPNWLIRAMRKLQSQSTGGASSISQHAAVAALTGDKAILAERRHTFERRRDLVCDELSKVSDMTLSVPKGAFYVFPSCAGFLGSSAPDGKTILNDLDFTNYLLEEANVATVNGEAYGASPFFRLSFATSEERLLEGCNRIRVACEALRR